MGEKKRGLVKGRKGGGKKVNVKEDAERELTNLVTKNKGERT